MEVTVTPDEAGKRVDAVLRSRFSPSRAEMRRLDADRAIRVNGAPAKKGHIVSAGDVITVARDIQPADFDPSPDPSLGLTIVHRDPDFLVVDKPAGVNCHPLRTDETGTVVQGLLVDFSELRGVGHARREAGLVHRLDRDTSGLLLVARNDEAFRALSSLLHKGGIDKGYKALCEGTVDTGVVTWPIVNHPGDSKRSAVLRERVDQKGIREAQTTIDAVEKVGTMTLVTAHAARAARHQIRVHLAELGHPLAGDILYGGSAVTGLERHFLHAHRMVIPHPNQGAEISVESPLPDDLRAALDTVRNDQHD